jgi:glyoxylase-like metal-dependent hydrolase (beta-lactamase superfamily II)
VFTGDTLFVGGVGAMFHGTPQQMVLSLRKLRCLSDACHVFW